jgi:ribose-phosphate pyrophosphokinase
MEHAEQQAREVHNGMKIFSGTAHPQLTQRIAEYLGMEVGAAQIRQFSDGEIWVKYNENIRGTDLFVVQPTFAPPRNLLELLMMIDAARRASARRITAVIPYFGYARQDRKDQPRVSVTAKLVANLITTAGADRVLTMDLHAPQIQGFFDIPVDHLYSATIFSEYFREMNIPNLTVVSPDTGGIPMARAYAKRLQAPLALIDKRRPEPDVAEVMNIIGEVDGRNILIIDDIVDTAGTLVTAAAALRKHGAERVYAACTHPILSGKAIQRLKESAITELVVTDSVPLPPEKQIDRIKVLSAAELFGEAIRRIHEERSISVLFD